MLPIAFGLLLGACGDKGNDRIPPAPSLVIREITTTTGAAAVATTTAIGTVPAGQTHTVGEAVVTASGNTITLHGIEPRTPDGRYAADVEACTGATSARIEASLFTIELGNGSALVPVGDGSGRQPVLTTTDLQPGACGRGWVSYQLPQDQAPVALVFRGSSVIRWSLV